jgi:hypothetical protein
MSTLQAEVRSKVRRSARLPITKSVQVSGVNVEGRDFASNASTLMLSRHGALIVVKQGLAPDQEVGVFNPDNARDEAARIVELFGKDAAGYKYGIEFDDPEVDFWNITFPTAPANELAESETKPTETVSERLSNHSDRIELLPLAPLLIAEIRPSRLVPESKGKSHDYSILLKCPYDNADEWMLLRDRSETLAQVLSTRWPFDCPIHGVQMEYPVIANEGTILQKDAADAGKGGKNLHANSKVPVQERYQQARRVWVSGVDALSNPFYQSTYSVNISRNGARLQGLGFLAGAGVEIELKRNWKKAVYRVVWMGQPGTSLASQVFFMYLTAASGGFTLRLMAEVNTDSMLSTTVGVASGFGVRIAEDP